MKIKTLNSIINKKKTKSEFAIITNLSTGESEIYEKKNSLSDNLKDYKNKIDEFLKLKKME